MREETFPSVAEGFSIVSNMPVCALLLFPKNQIRETIQGLEGITLKRFWQERGEENDVAETIGSQGAMDELFGRVVRVSMSDKMYVMARWFPPPPREDLV